MRQICLLVCLILLASLSPAFADGNGGYVRGMPPQTMQQRQPQTIENTSADVNTRSTDLKNTPFNKLGRGLANMATFYLEIPATAEREAKAKHSEVFGATAGILGGFGMALLRALSGVFDTVTFIFAPYDQPLMQPAYAYDSFMQADANSSITTE